MAETKTYVKTSLLGWLVVGLLLTIVVVFLWLYSDLITTVIFVLGIGLGLGIGSIVIVNEALVLTTIQALQAAGENAVEILSLRKNMRAVLAVWIMGLFTLAVVMTVFNQLDLDKFNAIMGVLGSFVTSVVAYYFAKSRESNE